MSVPMPAMTIQFCISATLIPLSMPTTVERIIIGVMLATNIAKMC